MRATQWENKQQGLTGERRLWMTIAAAACQSRPPTLLYGCHYYPLDKQKERSRKANMRALINSSFPRVDSHSFLMLLQLLGAAGWGWADGWVGGWGVPASMSESPGQHTGGVFG